MYSQMAYIEFDSKLSPDLPLCLELSMVRSRFGFRWFAFRGFVSFHVVCMQRYFGKGILSNWKLEQNKKNAKILFQNETTLLDQKNNNNQTKKRTFFFCAQQKLAKTIQFNKSYSRRVACAQCTTCQHVVIYLLFFGALFLSLLLVRIVVHFKSQLHDHFVDDSLKIFVSSSPSSPSSSSFHVALCIVWKRVLARKNFDSVKL